MKKCYRHTKLFLKMKFGKPDDFAFIEGSEGEPVGPELQVVHLTCHDMAEWACRCRLTEEVILNDTRANAIKVTGFRRLNESVGITTFQPFKI